MDLINYLIQNYFKIYVKNKPQALNFIVKESDFNILMWYSFLARSIINYYKYADNFHKIKSIINYQIDDPFIIRYQKNIRHLYVNI